MHAAHSRGKDGASAKLGIQGLPVPAEFGGQGADPLTIMLAMEALGYACKDNGLIFSTERANVGLRDANPAGRERGAEAAIPSRLM